KTGTAEPKSVRAALEAALAAQMGGQGVAAAAAASPGGATVLGNSGNTGGGLGTGNLANGVGAPPLSSKVLAALTGDGKNGNAAANAAALNAKAAQGGANAQDAGASAAQALAASGASNPGAAADFATLKDTADAARAALAAAQAAQQAQGTQATSATAAAATTSASAAAATLAPQVGTPDWEDALSQKVVFLSNAHQQSAELTLNPRDLGPLQVVLQVADNHAHALFVSQHAQVREAVEAALPKLRDALEAGGLGLGSASVSDGFARQNGQQDARSGNGGNGRGRGGSFGGGSADDAVASAASVPVRRQVGIVDTFA
ncbi:MAG: flagellar hook-length control protein FliK, partial [Trinickia sp.]|uniref:flagellar hook-length control protein FliK n=1 Tax=Trinickia sp. TaxID=2571163 RepID=UPI003F7D507F